MSAVLLAQEIGINGQKIKGPLVGIETLGDFINKIIAFLIPLAAVILFLVLIWGGYDFMLSQGNPEKVKSAKGKITTGLVGFILLIISYLLVKLITQIFFPDSGFF